MDVINGDTTLGLEQFSYINRKEGKQEEDKFVGTN